MAKAATKPGSTKPGSTKPGSAKPGSTKPASKEVKVATPWGQASVVEELSVPQRVGDRRFSSLVQLLETAKGEQLIRFAYSTDGVARRGPVTLRVRDLERLRAELGSRQQLADALGFADSGGDA